jgi:hypothetical protein
MCVKIPILCFARFSIPGFNLSAKKYSNLSVVSESAVHEFFGSGSQDCAFLRRVGCWSSRRPAYSVLSRASCVLESVGVAVGEQSNTS